VVRRRVEQTRVLAQSRDDDHRRPERVQQFEDSEVTVADGHDGSPWQPAAQGQQQQARPLGRGAVLSAVLLGPRLARGQRAQHRQPLRWYSSR
jgi:hypothetical protein